MLVDEISYVSGGVFHSEGLWKHPARIIDTHEIIIMKSGTAFIEEQKNEYCLLKDQILLLEPQKAHSGYRESTDPVSFYWFHFSGHLPPKFLAKSFQLKEPYRTELICNQLLHYANTSGYPPEAADCLICLLLMELHAESLGTQSKNKVLAESSEWIRVHSNQPVTTTQVAGIFGYNEDYLSKLFHSQFGFGLKQYISRQRMNYIKKLLLSSHYTLQQVAEMSGFTDYKYFLKFFSYHEKATPTEFRALYFNTHMNNQ